MGRSTELRLLLTAIGRGKAVLLVGLPGVSKTTIVRAVAGHLSHRPDGVLDVTGDEQLTAQALVGTFDPPMVLRDGYRDEHFVSGPLVRAMQAGGILYLEELNRAPSGALNVLMTALSERYLEVPRLGRVDARDGFTVVGAANPLDDVGTARLSRGLVDRFLLLPLDYQSREEELEIVRRRCGDAHAGFHAFAVDVARESRGHPDLRHGASVRGAIDMVDLLGGWTTAELDLATLRRLACTAYGGRLRVKPAAHRSACEIVDELVDTVLRRDYRGELDGLLEHAAAAPRGEPAQADAESDMSSGDGGDAVPGEGGERRSAPARPRDEIPGLSRPGSGGEAGESRSVPMVDRDRPSGGGSRPVDLTDHRDTHMRDPEAVLREARELVLRVRDGAGSPAGQPTAVLQSEPWHASAAGTLDVEATIDAFVATAGNPEPRDFRLLTRRRDVRNYVILIDHSGSMVGPKLELGATMAAALAQLSAAGRADYAVIAFDDDLKQIKALGEPQDVEAVVDRILRLPEGRATDLGKVLRAAAAASEPEPDATDVILISDCMPTRGLKTFPGLAREAGSVPSLYICFTDDRSPAIHMYQGQRQLDLYEWWARQWVGDGRFSRFSELEDVDAIVDLLSTQPDPGGR